MWNFLHYLIMTIDLKERYFKLLKTLYNLLLYNIVYKNSVYKLIDYKIPHQFYFNWNIYFGSQGSEFNKLLYLLAYFQQWFGHLLDLFLSTINSFSLILFFESKLLSKICKQTPNQQQIVYFLFPFYLSWLLNWLTAL